MYKLLIVDDEYVEIEALTYIVRSSDLPIKDIMTASNGRQAIKVAKEFGPDLILMDIKMPGITGIEAAAVIMDLYPKCKIVFLSAYNYFEYAQEALRLKANDFLIKPVSNDTLIEVLNGLITSTEKESSQLALNTSIENQFRQISTLFENELINYLLFADVKEQQLKEYLSALNCTPSYFHTLIVAIEGDTKDDLSSLKSTMIKGRCIKTFKEHLNPLSDRCFANYQKNYLYFLINTKTPITANKSKSTLLHIQTLINSHYHIQCRCVISNAFEDLMAINHNFLSHKQSLLFNQNDDVIVYPSITYKTSNRFSSKKEQMMLESIELSNTPRILANALEFTNWVKSNHLSMTDSKYQLIGMVAYINKSLCKSHEASGPELESLYMDYLHKIDSTDQQEALFSCFSDRLLYMANALNQDQATMDSPIIAKLCHYIDDHYMHDLSLKDLSDDLNMNSQYISKLFKDQKAITFSDYLTDVRISKAKELLSQTQNSIQDIGLSVGYNDPNYFTRAFRKHEAITPKQYRMKTYTR